MNATVDHQRPTHKYREALARWEELREIREIRPLTDGEIAEEVQLHQTMAAEAVKVSRCRPRRTKVTSSQ